MKELKWASTPCAPRKNPERYFEPHICRLALAEGSFTLEWFDNGGDGAHTLYYRLRGSEDEYTAFPLTDKCATVTGLKNDCDYELFIERDDKSARSHSRLVNPCTPPGVVINYVHPEETYFDFAGIYPASPSIVKLPSGNFLATHDIFGFGNGMGMGFVFISRDGGVTWEYQTEINPLHWATPFVVKGRLYLFGCFGESGNFVISESLDEGKTWSEPVILMYTDKKPKEAALHRGPVPIIEHNGRIYTGFEIGAWASRGEHGFEHSILSASVDSDLLNIDSWEHTPFGTVPQDKFLDENSTADYVVAIEGNAVAGPDGNIYNMLRLDPMTNEVREGSIGLNNACVLFRLKNFDEKLEFVGKIDAPVGMRCKFFVAKDESTGLYFLLGNERTSNNPTNRRCLITLSVSNDLVNWRKLCEVLDCTDMDKHGIGYVSFCFDGDDIVFISRTAWGKLKDEHDNNTITFHRIKNYKSLI